MTNRKQKITELLENLNALRRSMALRDIGFLKKMPRITPSQWGVVMLIEQGESAGIKGIARALRITSSAATQLADGLVRNGYVERVKDPKDRRAVSLVLSKKTKNRVEEMKQRAVRKFLKLFNVLTDAEFNQYCALNKKLCKTS